jgi:methylated-DNA-[protein]-cysteine S-methyltransferase
MTRILRDRLQSPLGRLTLFLRDGALCALDLGDGREARARLRFRFGTFDEIEAEDPAGVTSRLRRYLEGDLGAVGALPVDPGGSDFQRLVWAGLRAIPVGQAVSYGELARAIGRPGSARAVGGANHENPIPIVIPCHRVIGADRSLTGYGGGLPAKRWLLRHEGVDFAEA